MTELGLLDDILVTNLFATLAGLSIAVAAFLYPRLKEGQDTVKKLQLDALNASHSAEFRSAASREADAAEKENDSLKEASAGAVYAFYLFVASIGLSLGFDAFDDLSQPVQIVDVSATGVPFVLGVLMLGLVAQALLPEGHILRRLYQKARALAGHNI